MSTNILAAAASGAGDAVKEGATGMGWFDRLTDAFGLAPVGIAVIVLAALIVIIVLSAVFTAIFTKDNGRRTGAQYVMDWLAVLVRGHRGDTGAGHASPASSQPAPRPTSAIEPPPVPPAMDADPIMPSS